MNVVENVVNSFRNGLLVWNAPSGPIVGSVMCPGVAVMDIVQHIIHCLVDCLWFIPGIDMVVQSLRWNDSMAIRVQVMVMMLILVTAAIVNAFRIWTAVNFSHATARSVC